MKKDHTNSAKIQTYVNKCYKLKEKYIVGTDTSELILAGNSLAFSEMRLFVYLKRYKKSDGYGF